MKFSKDSIKINPGEETKQIISGLRSLLLNKFRRKGAVIGISGGIDSSVTLALCAKAFGNKKVIALMQSKSRQNALIGVNPAPIDSITSKTGVQPKGFFRFILAPF